MKLLNEFEMMLVSGGDSSSTFDFSIGDPSGGMCMASDYASFNVGDISYPASTANANTDPTASWGMLSPTGFVVDAFAIGTGIGNLIYNAITGK